MKRIKVVLILDIEGLPIRFQRRPRNADEEDTVTGAPLNPNDLIVRANVLNMAQWVVASADVEDIGRAEKLRAIYISIKDLSDNLEILELENEEYKVIEGLLQKKVHKIWGVNAAQIMDAWHDLLEEPTSIVKGNEEIA